MTEAHMNGVPVLASNRGGLPESVGPGGVLIDPDSDLNIWLSVLSKIWDDKNYYESLVNSAREYSQRIPVQPKYLMDRFIDIASDAVNI